MHLDSEDMAIVGGGGTAALGFVLGVVQRYVGPRLDALRDRLQRAEAEIELLQKRIDDVSSESSHARTEMRRDIGQVVTKAHDRINPLEAAIARIEGKLSSAWKVDK